MDTRRIEPTVEHPPEADQGIDVSKIPQEFEPWTYRSLHSDLWYMQDDDLVDHYERVGRIQGRRAHPLATRESLRDLVAGCSRILEIGPFFNPLFEGPNVRYFDVLDKTGLERHAADLGYANRPIPEIDFVSTYGDLSIVTGVFDIVASSHAVEHQPDLAAHLRGVGRLLAPGGLYVLFIPDKRYCFDHFVPESTIADVVEAALEQRISHSLRTLIRHDVLRTHNESIRHWQGDHGRPEHLDGETIATAIDLFEQSTKSGRYVDRHAWQFTPQSFKTTVRLLNEIGMISLAPFRVYDTLAGHNEFWAILQAPSGGQKTLSH